MHFAASIQVEESVREPLAYYRNNVVNTLNLLEAMREAGVRHFIYSSTAAVYGIPEKIPVDEQAPLAPINPYGASKMMIETGPRGSPDRNGFPLVGAPLLQRRRGGPGRPDRPGLPEATHLITRALKTAKGEYPKLAVYGTDYPTPDGTCIRDYIHVDDLAVAHLLALDRLVETGGTESHELRLRPRLFGPRGGRDGEGRSPGSISPWRRRAGAPAILPPSWPTAAASAPHRLAAAPRRPRIHHPHRLGLGAKAK